MSKIFLRVVCLLGMMGILVPVALASDGEAQVRENFGRYCQAVMAYQGGEAARWVTDSTLVLYATYINLALHGSKKEIEKQPLTDQINILTMRHKIPTAELNAMDGRALFVYTVDHQWTKKEAVEVQSLGKTDVKGNVAKAVLLVNGKPLGLTLSFLLEGGVWKTDLTSLVKKSSDGLKWIALTNGMSAHKLLLQSVEAGVGHPLGDALWNLPSS